jgi:hypothetical protein
MEGTNQIFLDSEGQGNPVQCEKRKINERKLTDALIFKTAIGVADFHIHIINRMDL